MRLPQARAVAIAARLKAVTRHEAQLFEGAGHLRIVSPLPDSLTAAGRVLVLLALADADRFGHEVTADGSSVWAEIDSPSLRTEVVSP